VAGGAVPVVTDIRQGLSGADGQAGGGAFHTGDGLNAGDDALAQPVEVVRMEQCNDVVGTGHSLGREDLSVRVRQGSHRLADVPQAAHLRLDEDIRPDGHRTPPAARCLPAPYPDVAGSLPFGSYR